MEVEEREERGCKMRSSVKDSGEIVMRIFTGEEMRKEHKGMNEMCQI